MVKRPGDTTPETPGGRAAERLRMFEEARRPPAPQVKKQKPAGKVTKPPKTAKRGRKPSAK